MGKGLSENELRKAGGEFAPAFLNITLCLSNGLPPLIRQG